MCVRGVVICNPAVECTLPLRSPWAPALRDFSTRPSLRPYTHPRVSLGIRSVADNLFQPSQDSALNVSCGTGNAQRLQEHQRCYGASSLYATFNSDSHATHATSDSFGTTTTQHARQPTGAARFANHCRIWFTHGLFVKRQRQPMASGVLNLVDAIQSVLEYGHSVGKSTK